MAKPRAEDAASLTWFHKYNAAAQGPSFGPLFAPHPVTGEPQPTSAFFDLAARVFTVSAATSGSSAVLVKSAQRRVVAAIVNALRSRDDEFFTKLVRSIRAHSRRRSHPDEANVLWLAKACGLYPPARKQMTTTEFRRRYKDRYRLTIDKRQLLRIYRKYGISLLAGKPGRPKTRTAEK